MADQQEKDDFEKFVEKTIGPRPNDDTVKDPFTLWKKREVWDEAYDSLKQLHKGFGSRDEDTSSTPEANPPAPDEQPAKKPDNEVWRATKEVARSTNMGSGQKR